MTLPSPTKDDEPAIGPEAIAGNAALKDSTNRSASASGLNSLTRPPVASLINVSHRYGKALALDSISVTFPASTTIGLIGPDGVGKSTLLSSIAGSRKIQQGNVQSLSGDMAQARHRRTVCSQIAFMPQGLGKIYIQLSPSKRIYSSLDASLDTMLSGEDNESMSLPTARA